jgi:predicted Zn-dependent peptidase
MTAKKYFDPLSCTTSFMLDNGLKLLVYNDPTFLGSHLHLNFYSGSLEDKKSGEAHALEHVTIHQDIPEAMEEKYFVFDLLSDDVPVRGTSYDDTSYCVSVPNNKLLPAGQFLVDITMNLPLPLQDVEKQLAIIYREYIEECDMLGSDLKVDRSQWKQIFSGTPYEKLYSVVGNAKSIKSLTAEDLYKFKEKHYIPKNAILIVLTSLNPKRVYTALNGLQIRNEETKEKERSSLMIEISNKRDVLERVRHTRECISEVGGNCMITLNCLTPYRYENDWVSLLFQHKARNLIRENHKLVYSVMSHKDVVGKYDLFTAKIIVEGGRKNTKQSKTLLEGLLELTEEDKKSFEMLKQKHINSFLLRRWSDDDVTDYLTNLNDPDWVWQKTIKEQFHLDHSITFDVLRNHWDMFFSTKLYFDVLHFRK